MECAKAKRWAVLSTQQRETLSCRTKRITITSPCGIDIITSTVLLRTIVKAHPFCLFG